MRKKTEGSIILAIMLVGINLLCVPGLSFSQPFSPEIVEQSKRATVGILSPVNDRASITDSAPFSIRGSGTHIGNGYILTARHAIERQEGGKSIAPKTIQVVTGDLYELTAHFIGMNAFLDIALYHLPEQDIPTTLEKIPFASRESLSGNEVFTVGYPLGWGPALSFGKVGNPNTFLETIESRLIQIDLSACSGNSGGGLFNTQGEIVGVVHAIIQTETTQGERRCSRFAFAVPGLVLKKVVQALIDGQQLTFSKLGLQLSTAKQDNRWAIAVGKASGPARQAGFKKGDIVVAIDDYSVHTAAELKNYLIEHTEPGQQIAVHILRNEQPRTLQVLLGGF